jgi:hypothetical protein
MRQGDLFVKADHLKVRRGRPQRAAPDHALAVAAAAYLDHAIELLLRSRLHGDLSPDDDNRLFNGAANGIFGTASAKIRV